MWAHAKAINNICEEKRGDIGELVGTPFVARDMMKIVDALNEDGKLRYWGKSCRLNRIAEIWRRQ